MENKCKRFLSLLLALVMVIGLMPVGHVHAEEAAELVASPYPAAAIEDGEQYVIVSVRTGKYLTDAEAVSTGANSSGAKGLALVNTAAEATVWTITANDDGTHTIASANGNVSVNGNNDTTLEADATVNIQEGLDKYHADGWEIRKSGTNCGLNAFDSFGDATSTGYAASAWSSDDDQGNQWLLYKMITADEFAAMDPYGKLRGLWSKVSVDTETISDSKEGNFEYAWDNNSGTHWHSDWSGGTDKVTSDDGTAGNMDTISGVIDFGQAYTINQFSFTPRTDKTDTGIVTKASLYIKENEGDEWTTVAEHITFAANISTKTFCFEAQPVRYVKFVAEQANDGWVTVSEFDIDNVADHFTGETTTPATCGVDGVMTYTCPCGYSYTEAIPATGEHVYDNDCTTADKCASCEQTATAADAHSFDNDCTTADKCENCEQTATAADAHSFDNDCSTADKCENCEQTATAADAHSFDNDCTTDDKCADCEQTAEANAEHTLDEGVHTDGTDGELGYTTYNCIVDGCDYTNVVDDEPEDTTNYAPAGWLDDQNEYVQYAEGWGAWNSDAVNYNGTIMFLEGDDVYQETATVTLPFIGSGIEIYSCTNSDRSMFEVLIDGESVGVVDTYSASTERQVKVFSKYDLDDGKHTLVIKPLMEKNEASSRLKLEIDAFRIVEEAEVEPDPVPAVTGFTAAPAELTAEGGEVTVTITGTDLPDTIQVKAGELEAVYAAGTATEQTATLTIPGNETEEAVTYTVKYSLDGETYAGEITVTVAAAEVEESVDPADPANKDLWTGAANSETVYDAKEGLFRYAWDNNTNTFWHTNWQGTNKDVLTGENTFTGEINFGKAYTINQFSFLPRQDDTMWENGSCVVLQASLFVKASEDDGWTCVADQVVFEHNQQLKTFYFKAQEVQFVKFVAQRASQMGLTDSNGPQGYVAVSEFYINDEAASDVTVTAAAQGGTVAGVPEAAVTAGASVTLTAVPNEGYTFDGWYNSLDTKVSEAAEYTFPAAKDIALTARFTANTYTVTFDHDYEGSTDTTRTVNHGQTVSNLPAPTRAGYTFDGWFDAEGNEFTSATVVTGDITVTAKWTLITTYTVTLDYGYDIEPVTVTVEEGETVAELPAPEREGYTFDGWFDAEGNAFTTETPVTANITVTAKWTVIPTYTVTLDYGYDIESVTVTVEEGETVAELPAPEREGYTFNGWFDAEGNAFTTETIVTADITVTAKWTEIVTEPDPTQPSEPEPSKPEVPECEKDETCVLAQFDDIIIADWYHDGVHFCVEEGIMNGMGDGVFAPNEATTRAQLVMMLYRLEGEPSIEGMTEPFTDVAETDWFYEPIVWAYNTEVVNGMSETTFEPNTNVSREQVATILYRYLDTPAGTGDLSGYPDVDKVQDYAKDALIWAVGEGLINGVKQADGTSLLDPAGNATRAQIATILMRYLTA